jgi:hypothetical protein
VIPPFAAVEARLTAIESAVKELRHFIAAEDRPDLGDNALAAEK